MSFIYHREKFISVQTMPKMQGIFSTLLIEDGKVFFLKEHIQRIKEHCKVVHIEFPGWDIATLHRLILLNQRTQGRCRLRFIVSKEGVTITLEQEKVSKKEIYLCMYPKSSTVFASNIKTWPYTKRNPLITYAQNQKADDCLTFDCLGNILEAGVANVFWIRKGTFFYPDPDLPYFKGIVLKQAIFLAKQFRFPIKKGKFSLQNLEDSTVFYCNSIKGILPVKKIANKMIAFDPSIIDLYLQGYRDLADSLAIDLLKP